MWAPDLPECRVEDSDRDRALTRVHLSLEGTIANRLIAGLDEPAVSSIDALRRKPDYAEAEITLIHINETHLRAVARHQTRFGEADGL